MGKKKYYAVKLGVNPGIYQTWSECERQIKGYSGAVYKSFINLTDAEKYMIGEDLIDNGQSDDCESVESINNQVMQEINTLKNGEVIAFVDGSYNDKEKKSGFGVIIIDEMKIETQLYKAFTQKLNSDFIELRNVAAELEGVKEAVKWAIAYNKTKIKIYYDYEGIEKWADGSWKAKKDITRKYVDFLKEKRNVINIQFCKVPAHSGIEYNEMADKLAGKSLLEKGYKTYDDGSIYFVGYSAEDWKKIIEYINEENEGLVEESSEAIKIEITTLQNRTRMNVTDLKNKVVINCYSNSNSYVQGKQTVLFQKIISVAVEMMSNEQTVIETLNKYHVLSISKEELEIEFEKLLPHYNEKRCEKHYNNLLTAVFNTMLTGYMPDYTSLVTPTFRSYEYYLHRILGDRLGLDTCDSKGNNNFKYFSKNSNGRYECNSRKRTSLNSEQLIYLNDLYNAYHYIRHIYTHWSVDDIDTAVITSMDKARDYLLKGLTLSDRYYTLF